MLRSNGDGRYWGKRMGWWRYGVVLVMVTMAMGSGSKEEAAAIVGSGGGGSVTMGSADGSKERGRLGEEG